MSAGTSPASQPSFPAKIGTVQQGGAPGALPPAKEQLQFTAFYPRSAPVETWSTLLVYAYVESALRAVRADAGKFKAQLGTDPSSADAWSAQPLARGERISIVPNFRGVTFNPERIAFDWTKDWHRAIFSFSVDKQWAGSIGNGEIIIFSGPLIVATLRISLRFTAQNFQDTNLHEQAAAYRYRKIFTSYSRDDTSIVQAIRKAYEVIGDESLLDSEDLRSGQNWNAELLRMIDSADLFQLFWSRRSARSVYVAQEWRYALQHYKYDGFIRPVYWERPMVRAPKELAHLHFAYYDVPRRKW